MNNEIKAELENLQHKIRYNIAKYDDYKRYENILTSYGLSNERILNELKKAGFNSLEEYVYKRQNANSLADKKMTEGDILAWLLGIGGALLLFWALTKNK